MIRLVTKWLLGVVAAYLVIHLVVGPVVDWLIPAKKERNDVLRVIHWLGSPASNLWFLMVVVAAFSLWAAFAPGDVTRGQRLALCVPALAGVVAGSSYRLASSYIPAAQQAMLHDPAMWSLLSGLGAALVALTSLGAWGAAQDRCSTNDRTWAYEKFYNMPYRSSGGSTFLICLSDDPAHPRSLPCTHDLEEARRRNLWVRFRGTDSGARDESPTEIVRALGR
jgi:hypothetical protein